MIDNRNFIVFDFETSSSNPAIAQILQIGACIIDQSLNIIDEFESLIKPEDEATIEPKAMEVNHLKIEELREAPEIKTIFPVFADWIKKYNTKKDKSTFGSPIATGYGIDHFDCPIFERYCKRFGYWDKKWDNQNLMNPVFTFDVMKYMWWLTRSNGDVANVKLGTVLEYAGVPKEEIESGAHSAVWDVRKTAQLAIKILNLGNYLSSFNTTTNKRHMEIKGCLKR